MIRKIYNKWTIHQLIIPFLVIFIFSCRVGKEYQQPALELPKQFSTVSFSDTSSIADIAWKNFFTNPGLQQLIDNGIKYNHDLLIAIKRIDIAQAKMKQAKLLQFPELNFQIGGQISRPSNNSLNGLSIKNFLGKVMLRITRLLLTFHGKQIYGERSAARKKQYWLNLFKHMSSQKLCRHNW